MVFLDISLPQTKIPKISYKGLSKGTIIQNRYFILILTRTTLDSCINSIGEVDSKDDVSHFLIHVSPKPDTYEKKTISFASSYVSEHVARKFQLVEHDKLKQFLIGGQEFSPFGSIRGFLFEGYVHNLLRGGGTFRIRDLSNPSKEPFPLQIPKCNEVVIRKYDDKVDKMAYCRPLASNWGAVDSWILDVGVFQITISENHPIKAKPIRELVCTFLSILAEF